MFGRHLFWTLWCWSRMFWEILICILMLSYEMIWTPIYCFGGTSCLTKDTAMTRTLTDITNEYVPGLWPGQTWPDCFWGLVSPVCCHGWQYWHLMPWLATLDTQSHWGDTVWLDALWACLIAIFSRDMALEPKFSSGTSWLPTWGVTRLS